jgi:tetratricopeptide (TPR) repeat protein
MVAGDVVNTAARLQTSAAPGPVVVGQGTWAATHRVIDYKELEPVTVKGKADRLPLWQALDARSRVGEAVATVSTPLVGRRDELEILQRTFARCVRESSVHLVTIVAEPGMGKSRLVQELFEWVDARPELITWRQGRCLPYGGGTPLWALGQVVKAHAGILDTDDREVVTHRLTEAISAVLEVRARQDRREDDASKAGWLASQLGPLVGVPGGEGSREELFAAAQAFLEAIAYSGPLILVIEDLHWAEQPMLELLEHLLEWVEGVPMMLLATARPEIYDAAPSWGGGRRNATTIGLAPLTDGETAQLVGALAGRSGLPPATEEALLERAAGNPLYAEEFTRMLAETGRLDDATAAEDVPDTVQAVIAARLDTLSAPAKATLHNAAVLGHTFWPTAVVVVGGLDAARIGPTLHDLARRDYLRPSRRSVFAGEAEHTFAHALIRDVAYEQIPRGDRAAKHLAAARWLAAAVGDNPGDYAAVIAGHYDQAQALAASSPSTHTEDAATLAAEAGRWHAAAADIVQPIDTVAAVHHYTQAAAGVPDGDPDRPRILGALADVLFAAGRRSEAVEAFREAERSYRSRGEVVRAASTAARRSSALSWMGRHAEAVATIEASMEELVASGAGPELVDAYARRARLSWTHHDECLYWANRAISLAEQLDASPERDRGLLQAIEARGAALGARGDPRAEDDQRRALALALEQQLTDDALSIYNTIANTHVLHSAADALDDYDQASLLARERGRHSMDLGLLSTNKAFTLGMLGRLEEALALCLACAKRLEASSQVDLLSYRAVTMAACFLAELGRFGEADDLLEGLDPTVAMDDPVIAVDWLRARYLCASARADESQMSEVIDTLCDLLQPELDEFAADDLFGLAALLVPAGRVDIVNRILRAATRLTPLSDNNATSVEAILHEAAGEYATAADLYLRAAAGWREYRYLSAEGQAVLGAARCRIRQGQVATDLVVQARDIFARIGAAPLMEEAETLLSATAS